jgi:hypothetical protein
MTVTLTAGVLAVVAVAGTAIAGDAVQITPAYRVGDRLHYSWHLENELSWSPEVKGADWVKMSTDFDFALIARHLLGDGSCLFDLDGETLKSVAEGAKGKLGIRATPKEASLLFGKKWTKPGPNSPLAKPMTVTMGKQFQPTASTGLESIALFLLPGVDARVWFVMTTAPPLPLKVGSTWSQNFDVPIPGAEGEPLDVAVTVKVVRIEKIDRAEVLTIETTGELNLTDTDLQLKTGEWMHILHGRYEVRGIANWDMKRGFLRFAEAEQSLRATADKPDTRRLASKAVSRLKLEKVN